jgi:hypothetical protein
MIKLEHLYPNKDWFERRNQAIPDSVEGLADNQLLIKLGGIKELAKLRGYKSIKYEIVKSEKDYVVVKCGIQWKESSFEDEIYFEDVANATLQNTDDFCAKFLETIAANRAFVRCVRNFLNIHIVGDEEIDKSKNKVFQYENTEQVVSDITPHGILRKVAKEKARCEDFDEFKNLLRKFWTEEVYKNEDAKSWASFKDIPAKECRKLISLIK